jgi:hypothetical protein
MAFRYVHIRPNLPLAIRAVEGVRSAPICVLLYFFVSSLHTEGIGNQDKRPGAMQMNRTCTFQSLILF